MTDWSSYLIVAREHLAKAEQAAREGDWRKAQDLALDAQWQCGSLHDWFCKENDNRRLIKQSLYENGLTHYPDKD